MPKRCFHLTPRPASTKPCWSRPTPHISTTTVSPPTAPPSIRTALPAYASSTRRKTKRPTSRGEGARHARHPPLHYHGNRGHVARRFAYVSRMGARGLARHPDLHHDALPPAPARTHRARTFPERHRRIGPSGRAAPQCRPSLRRRPATLQTGTLSESLLEVFEREPVRGAKGKEHFQGVLHPSHRSLRGQALDVGLELSRHL